LGGLLKKKGGKRSIQHSLLLIHPHTPRRRKKRKGGNELEDSFTCERGEGRKAYKGEKEIGGPLPYSFSLAKKRRTRSILQKSQRIRKKREERGSTLYSSYELLSKRGEDRAEGKEGRRPRTPDPFFLYNRMKGKIAQCDRRRSGREKGKKRGRSSSILYEGRSCTRTGKRGKAGHLHLLSSGRKKNCCAEKTEKGGGKRGGWISTFRKKGRKGMARGKEERKRKKEKPSH